MTKKILSAAFIGLLILAVNSSVAFGQTADAAAKIKANVAKRGASDRKKVTVKMLDGTKEKGYITQIGADSFDLRNSATKRISTVAYRDVADVTNGGGLSTASIVTLAVVGGVAVVIGTFVGIRCRNEGGCL